MRSKLLCLMLLSVLAACGDEGKDDNDDGNNNREPPPEHVTIDISGTVAPGHLVAWPGDDDLINSSRLEIIGRDDFLAAPATATGTVGAFACSAPTVCTWSVTGVDIGPMTAVWA